MRLAFLGTPDFAVPTLAALVEAGHDIACVYSQPPAPAGRGRALRPSAVQTFAERLGLPVRTPTRLKSRAALSEFQDLDLDVAVVAAFGQILSQAVLDAPRLGCFNLHASLLPRWRGAAPIQRAIMAGDTVTGVAVMRMSAGLDEGAVLEAAATPIGADDTAGSLHDRLAALGAPLMVEALGRVERGKSRETVQPSEGVTYARKLNSTEARLDWNLPAAAVDRHIRGLSPFPGAWFEAPSARGPVRIKVLMSRAEEGPMASPGEVLDADLLIACNPGAVRLLRLQREGRGPKEAAEFLRGFDLPVGRRL